jgi:hypothetical protein
MRYMLLIYQNENQGPRSPEEAHRITEGHWAVMDETKRLGIFCGAEPLEPTSTATTIRTQEGKVVTLDGPFAETKEQLAGYYILDCKNLDEAISWASKLQLHGGCGGETCIEIRPLRPLPARTSQPVDAQHAAPVNG